MSLIAWALDAWVDSAWADGAWESVEPPVEPLVDDAIKPIHGYNFENDRRLLKARREKERLDKLSFAEQLEVIKPKIATVAKTDTEAAQAFVDRITALVPKQAVKQSTYAIEYVNTELVNQRNDSDDEAIALIIAALL